jgi:hypothetical protein
MSDGGRLTDEEMDEIAARLAERLRGEAGEEPDGGGRAANGRDGGGTDLWDRIAGSLAPAVDDVAGDVSRPPGAEFGGADAGHGVVLPEHSDAPTVLFEAEVTEDGRVPVPDAETAALDLAPGDAVVVTMSRRE